MWDEHFLELFRRCLAEYREGRKEFEDYYTPGDLEFLASIGYKPRELFDFVEDLADEGEPAESAALLVAAVRRDYFEVVQGRIASRVEITAADLPTFGDELGGMAYLPRILRKARAKLRGELDPDLMFGCGGDRKFLREHGDLHPADFLRNVWAAGDDDSRVMSWINEQMSR